MNQNMGMLECRQPIHLKNVAAMKYKNSGLKVETKLEMNTKWEI